MSNSTYVELHCARRLTYTSSETDMSCIPNLPKVDRQALFCTFVHTHIMYQNTIAKGRETIPENIS